MNFPRAVRILDFQHAAGHVATLAKLIRPGAAGDPDGLQAPVQRDGGVQLWRGIQRKGGDVRQRGAGVVLLEGGELFLEGDDGDGDRGPVEAVEPALVRAISRSATSNAEITAMKVRIEWCKP